MAKGPVFAFSPQVVNRCDSLHGSSAAALLEQDDTGQTVQST